MTVSTSFSRRFNVSCSMIAGLAGLIISCSGGSEYRWAGTVDSLGPVPIVRNPTTPLIPAGDISARHVWTTPQSSSQEEFWENPTRVSADSHSLLVLDPPAHKVYVVSHDGVWTGTIGRQGDGPGEFQRPLAAASMAGGIVVVDGGKSTLETFDNNGVHASSVRLEWAPFGATRIGTDRWLIGGWDYTAGGSRIYDLHGTPSPIEFLPADGLGSDGHYCGYTWFGDFVFALTCTVPTIHEYDYQGRMVSAFSIDRAPEETTEAEMNRHLEDVRQTMASSGMSAALISRMVEQERETSRIKRKYGTLRASHQSGLFAFLEQNPDHLGSGPATIHLLTELGVFLGSIPFAVSWADFDILDGRLFALARDPATDLVSLEAYDIEFPEGALAAANQAIVDEQ